MSTRGAFFFDIGTQFSECRERQDEGGDRREQPRDGVGEIDRHKGFVILKDR